jgi:hypothetical protein
MTDMHVADMVQKCVGEGIDMTHPNVGFSDMSAPCQQMSAKNYFEYYFLDSDQSAHSNQIMRCGSVIGGWRWRGGILEGVLSGN